MLSRNGNRFVKGTCCRKKESGAGLTNKKSKLVKMEIISKVVIITK